MIKHWLAAIRIHTLPAGAAPVLIGISLAHYQNFEINYFLGALTLLTCLLLQISSNLINDYYDGIKGTDNNKRIGFQRMTASGSLSANKVKIGFIITLLIAFFIGLFLSFHSGIFIFSLGILSIVFAYLYTGGPYPLSYFALGEVFAFIFFGPVAVVGSNYIQTGVINYLSLVYGLVPGFIAAAIMAINNLRDREQDKEANKKTLANSMTEQKARIFVLLNIIFANIILVYLTRYNAKIYLALIPAFLFFMNWKHILTTPIDTKFNGYLKNTGKYLTLTALIISLCNII